MIRLNKSKVQRFVEALKDGYIKHKFDEDCADDVCGVAMAYGRVDAYDQAINIVRLWRGSMSLEEIVDEIGRRDAMFRFSNPDREGAFYVNGVREQLRKIAERIVDCFD